MEAEEIKTTLVTAAREIIAKQNVLRGEVEVRRIRRQHAPERLSRQLHNEGGELRGLPGCGEHRGKMQTGIARQADAYGRGRRVSPGSRARLRRRLADGSLSFLTSARGKRRAWRCTGAGASLCSEPHGSPLVSSNRRAVLPEADNGLLRGFAARVAAQTTRGCHLAFVAPRSEARAPLAIRDERCSGFIEQNEGTL